MANFVTSVISIECDLNASGGDASHGCAKWTILAGWCWSRWRKLVDISTSAAATAGRGIITIYTSVWQWGIPNVARVDKVVWIGSETGRWCRRTTIDQSIKCFLFFITGRSISRKSPSKWANWCTGVFRIGNGFYLTSSRVGSSERIIVPIRVNVLGRAGHICNCVSRICIVISWNAIHCIITQDCTGRNWGGVNVIKRVRGWDGSEGWQFWISEANKDATKTLSFSCIGRVCGVKTEVLNHPTIAVRKFSNSIDLIVTSIFQSGYSACW